MLRAASREAADFRVPIPRLGSVADQIEGLVDENRRWFHRARTFSGHRKDVSLDRLAEVTNVAQFLSFSPNGVSNNSAVRQEFSRIVGLHPNERFRSPREGITLLLEKSVANSINLRSFTPDQPQSREFIYGVRSVDDASPRSNG